jgi:2-keto-4-pentenoate hydratase/2-oxohepta-3-ene-1,7-dioic acid hydratase in catechol pathway
VGGVLMRLISFSPRGVGGVLIVGIDNGNDVTNLNQALQRPELTMRQFLNLGKSGLQQAAEAIASGLYRVSKADICIKAPIYDPEKVICIGMNYADHCAEQNQPIPKEPVVFSKFPSAIIAPGEDIVHEGTAELDFEVEMVIVIGQTCKAVSKEDALQYVVGFATGHDVSARDWQLKRNGGQWLLGKTFDGYAPLGPIVTKDEIKDVHNLRISCQLNGQTVQDSSTSQMVFKTGDIVEWVSRHVTLKPGDLIFTGTPPGVGCFRKPPLFLKAGDVVTCAIEGLGHITNKIAAPSRPRARL